MRLRGLEERERRERERGERERGERERERRERGGALTRRLIQLRFPLFSLLICLLPPSASPYTYIFTYICILYTLWFATYEREVGDI